MRVDAMPSTSSFWSLEILGDSSVIGLLFRISTFRDDWIWSDCRNVSGIVLMLLWISLSSYRCLQPLTSTGNWFRWLLERSISLRLVMRWNQAKSWGLWESEIWLRLRSITSKVLSSYNEL